MLRRSYTSFLFCDAFIGLLHLGLGLLHRLPDIFVSGGHIFGTNTDLSQLPMHFDKGRN